MVGVKMVKLTYKDKKLTYDDKRAIEAQKREMIAEQGCCCYVCHKPFSYYNMPQFAHRIPKYVSYIKKYGYEVIHHKKNTPITCPDCNVKVSLNPSSNPIEAQELINEIMEDLNNN
jgi:hypothetical protein